MADVAKTPENSNLYQRWYRDGGLWVECMMVDDILEGTYRQWFPDGTLKIECTCVKGIIQGKFEKWDGSGKKIIDAIYKDGLTIQRIL